MPKFSFLVVLSLSVCVFGQGSGNGGNLRLCIVEGRGYRNAPRHCPTLDRARIGIECVVATDRMDCLRRISKGTVDFAVVDPEDLVAAQWANIDLLVTNELKTKDRTFKSEIACVVARRILPELNTEGASSVLNNSTLCHPGHGALGISDTLSEYLESLITEQSCDPSLSLAENRLRSVSRFFNTACKPGPWVKDAKRDGVLKRRYANLCARCEGARCDESDLFYGTQGVLNCLTSGGGDVTWANVDDVRHRFGLNGERERLDDPSEFAYLCRDGSWQPLNSTAPCVWLNVPWPVIVAKRKSAEAVSTVQEKLTDDNAPVEGDWKSALLALLESRTALPEPMRPQRAPEDYLGRARGFREAYSRTGCNPSRHVTLCTASALARNKCEWMSEAGAVYGVEPPLQCSQRASVKRCVRAVADGSADVVVADSDWLVPAQRDFSLQPVLFERNHIMREMTIIVAFVKADSQIKSMADLKNKMAAFPAYDGVAWHSQPIDPRTSFGGLCVLGASEVDDPERELLSKLCPKKTYSDANEEVLRLLVEGTVDVAFVSMDSLNKYTGYNGSHPWSAKVSKRDFRSICPYSDEKYCYFSWSSPGQVYVRRNATETRRQEIVNVFQQLDRLFGKTYPFDYPSFTMYGPYGNTSHVIFHDNMASLTTQDDLVAAHPFDKYPRNFENMYQMHLTTNYAGSTVARVRFSSACLAAALVTFLFF